MEFDGSNLYTWLSSTALAQHKTGKRYLRNLRRNILQYNDSNKGLLIHIYLKNGNILPGHLVSCPKTINSKHLKSYLLYVCNYPYCIYHRLIQCNESVFKRLSGFPNVDPEYESMKRKVVTCHDVPLVH